MRVKSNKWILVALIAFKFSLLTCLAQNKAQSILFANGKQPNTFLRIEPFKHTAFFCRMEDKLHARFNVWIKLRAGSDEIYRKMIVNPREYAGQ